MPLALVFRGTRVALRVLGISAITAALSAGAVSPVFAQDVQGLSIEQLLDMEVTSVSRRAQPLSETAASVYVVTSEDIRRSGAQTVPDALRLVPGLHVGVINSNEWSVSMRGFSSRFVDTLLVMVDGQVVYSPLFSGVFWNGVAFSPAEIDRIEVIRGPGGTMWGANAVNGVINIITQSAAASRGNLVTVSPTTAGLGTASFHTAAALNQSASYRFDASASETQPVKTVGLAEDTPSWQLGRVSGRFDVRHGADEFNVSGSAVWSRGDVTLVVPTLVAPYMDYAPQEFGRDVFSGFGRWTRHRERTETMVQASVEHSETALTILSERRDTIAFDFQQALAPARRHRMVWGAGYRRSADDTVGTSVVTLTPPARTLSFVSIFAQDEVTWFRERLRITVGSKFERNDFSGWEPQPNVRGLVQLSRHQSIWAAVSRAVGLPSRSQSDGLFQPIVSPPTAYVPFPQVVQFVGNGGVDAAIRLTAYELGYRAQPHASVSLDVSSYFNDYRHLLGTAPGMPSFVPLPVPHIVQPVQFVGGVDRRYKGAEVNAEWHPSPRFRLIGGYSAFLLDRTRTAVAPGFGSYPTHQALLRVSATLPGNVEADLTARHVGALPDTTNAAYSAIDARIGRRWGRFEAAIVARNLPGPDHVEYVPDMLNSMPTAARRWFGLQFRQQF